MTLGEALARRDNALNFIRLLLAAGVIIGHSYQASGIEAPTEWLNPRIQEWSVNGFFAVSGYLIAGSRMRLPFRVFLERRARRLLPGLWVVLVVVAFGFAPVVAWLTGEDWSPRSSLTYVANNFLIHQGQLVIDDTLTNVPDYPQWNGPLWTLVYEAGCYVAVGVALSLQAVRRHAAIACAVLLVVLMALHPVVMMGDYVAPPSIRYSIRLGSFFAAGVLCWFLRDRIPARWSIVVACAVALVALSLLSDGQWYGQLFAAVALLSAGSLLPIRVGATNDISYGVYIYGWPIQQTLANVGAASLGIFAFHVLALVLVVPFAFASWFLIERRWLSATRRPRVEVEDADLLRS